MLCDVRLIGIVEWDEKTNSYKPRLEDASKALSKFMGMGFIEAQRYVSKWWKEGRLKTAFIENLPIEKAQLCKDIFTEHFFDANFVLKV
jgi:hypothetical protein